MGGGEVGGGGEGGRKRGRQKGGREVGRGGGALWVVCGPLDRQREQQTLARFTYLGQVVHGLAAMTLSGWLTV